MLIKLPYNRVKRIQKLKRSLVDKPPGICAERAWYYTEAYKEFQSDSPIVRRAKALRLYLENMTIYIGDEDLLAGYQASCPRWAPIFPEYSWEWIHQELDLFEHRKYDPFTITSEVKEKLCQLLPWWKGKSLFEHVDTLQPDFVKEASKIGVINWTGQATSGEGHIVVDYEMVFKKGFAEIINQARKLKEDLLLYNPENFKKREFYNAVEIAFEGVLNFARRLSEAFEKKASIEMSTERKNELLTIAGICRRVPAQPASSFYEALQTVWFVHLLQQIESNGHSVSLGRFDQYMYPYYKKDLASRRLSQQEALELIEHFYLKLFSIIKLRSEKHSRTQSGYPMYQNLVVGGQTPEGIDAVNDLSYLCLTALADVQLSEPNLYVRCHDKTPKKFWRMALKVVKLGTGMPAFVNDKTIIPSLMNREVSLRDAFNYSTMGCLEVQVPGKWGYRANGKSKINLLKILELALNDGCDPKTGIQLCKGRGDLTELETFDELLVAWRQQLAYYTQVHVTADNLIDMVLEELVPNAFCSALVQDCLSRGKHLNEGGAIYDMTSGALVGVPNVGNALAALKKLVYEKKQISLLSLKEALIKNFSGSSGQQVRQILLNQVSKYGDDDDYVDRLTSKVISDYAKIISTFKNMRYNRGPIGGIYFPSTVTISANVPAGNYVGPTPDGRKDQEPLADGISPSQGTGSKGPTAIIRSVSKLPTVLVTGGQLLNMRINLDSLNSIRGWNNLRALIQTLFDLYGWHIQINTISTEILRDAQRHPERYKDLIVRVAGYSAIFVALDPVLQADIIARLEYKI